MTDVKGSLAALVRTVFESSKPSAKPAASAAGKLQHSVPGVFTPREGSRLSILNGSHTTISEHHDRETVLIFPDYRIVFGVESTPKAAELLYEKAVSPSTTYIPTIPEEQEDGELPFGILPIPYSCVVLLCASPVMVFCPSFNYLYHQGSHKRRDNRCHVASSILEHGECTHGINHGTSPKTTCAHRIHSRLATTELDGRYKPRPPPPPRRSSPIKTCDRGGLPSRPRPGASR